MTEDSAAGPEFTELAHFEIDGRSVRLLEYDYCVEKRGRRARQGGSAGPEPVTGRHAAAGAPRAWCARSAACSAGRCGPCRSTTGRSGGRSTSAGARRSGDRRRLDSSCGPVPASPSAPRATVPELLDEILGRAVELGASDIHIETYDQDVDVRFRVDGVDAAGRHPLVHRQRSGGDRAPQGARRPRHRRAAAGAGRAHPGGLSRSSRVPGRGEPKGRAVDFRLSVVPGPVRRGRRPAHPGQRGSPRPRHASVWGRCAGPLRAPDRQPRGDAAGDRPHGERQDDHPLRRHSTTSTRRRTRSSPSRTPSSTTSRRPTRSRSPPLMSFADYARAFMRQNPDVILIGEMRDEETADAAIRAAQTGHLVLSTLHTGDAVAHRRAAAHAGDRLRPGRLLLAGRPLAAAGAPALPALPRRGRRRTRARPGDSASGQADGAFSAVPSPDCEVCDGFGYKGRQGIYELFVLDDELADLIADGAPLHRLRAAARKEECGPSSKTPWTRPEPASPPWRRSCGRCPIG